MKKCTKCKEIKHKSEFNKNKREHGGLRYSCKECDKFDRATYRRTKHGLITIIYNAQKSSSRKRGHTQPSYSMNDFYDWIYSQKKFHHIFHLWEISNYDKRLRPSIDRLDDYEPYSFSNIQLITWGENTDKGHADRISGKNNKQSRAVLMFTKDGFLVREYYSIKEAMRQTNIDTKSIGMCCRGEGKSAGGFKWEYK